MVVAVSIAFALGAAFGYIFRTVTSVKMTDEEWEELVRKDEKRYE